MNKTEVLNIDDVFSEKHEKCSSFFFGQRTTIRVGALPGLDLFNEHVASKLSTKLSQKIGREVLVQPKATINQIFGRFLHGMDPPIAISVLQIENSPHMGLMSIDGDILYHILEVFFGGSGESDRPFRNFSTIEMKIINNFMNVVLEQVNLAWQSFDPSFQMTITRWENQPQFSAVMPLDESVFLIIFVLEIGDTEGTLTLCVPHYLLQKFKHVFSIGYNKSIQNPEQIAKVTSVLSDVSVPVSVIVAQQEVLFSDVLCIKKGTVFNIFNGNGCVLIDGLQKFMCSIDKNLKTNVVTVIDDQITNSAKFKIRGKTMKKGEKNIPNNLQLLSDVSLNITVRLGSTIMSINNVLKLQKGSIIEFDNEVDAPLEIWANDKLIGYAEVVMIKDKLGVRITRLVEK